MLNKHRLMAVAVALAFSAGSALAAVSSQEAAKLGDTLTPLRRREGWQRCRHHSGLDRWHHPGSGWLHPFRPAPHRSVPG
jgi:hypothetical protein